MKNLPFRYLSILVTSSLLSTAPALHANQDDAINPQSNNSLSEQSAPETEFVSAQPVVTEAAKLIGTAQNTTSNQINDSLSQQPIENQTSNPSQQNIAPVDAEELTTNSLQSQHAIQELNTDSSANTSFRATEFAEAKQTLIEKEINVIFPNSVQSVYESHPFLLWQNQESRQTFIEQLSVVAFAGINTQFATWLTQLQKDNLSIAEQDLLLTDAFLGYLNFVSGVSQNGTKWLYSSNSYKLSEAPKETIESWLSAVKNQSNNTFIANLAPQHRFYLPMLTEMKQLMKQSQIDWPVISIEKSLKPGSSTNQAKNIETVLTYYGFLDLPEFKKTDTDQTVNQEELATSTDTSSDVMHSESHDDTRYNARLVNGIKYFQQSLGLEPDGIIGQRTKEWLNVSPEQRVNLIALNIERLRLIPSDVDTGIMVNIPDYSLKFYREGSVILDSRVIVGSPARKTPLMSNSINRVVINPPWSVPVKLAREDIAPKGVNDPNYFIKHGYTLIEPGTNQPIGIDEINWDYVTPDNFPFAVRQSPGAGNSLGRYKFDMPNDQAIYLHDTPNHRLFEKDIRAISSGCIRVNKSTELANLLLEPKNWNSDKIAGTVKTGNTTPVNLDNRVPVQLYYLTAWVDDSGKAQFRTDIYQYDKSALKNSSVSHIKTALM